MSPSLKALVSEYEKLMSRSQTDDGSDIPERCLCDLQARCCAAILRASGRDSIYYQKLVEIGETTNDVDDHLEGQIGVMKSLLSDMRNGYRRSPEEYMHEYVFGDMLDMADHLGDSGYKDAAALIAGFTLGTHLGQLCLTHGVATVSSGNARTPDTVNAELVKAGAYSQLDQKNVTDWLGLMNDALHGNYTAYDAKQVTSFITSIRDFIKRHPP